jgi:hypothetical protein
MAPEFHALAPLLPDYGVFPAYTACNPELAGCLVAPELIEHMRIGYAPGGCLRDWLTQLIAEVRPRRDPQSSEQQYLR